MSHVFKTILGNAIPLKTFEYVLYMLFSANLPHFKFNFNSCMHTEKLRPA